MALLPELRDTESMAVTTTYVYSPRKLLGFLPYGLVMSNHSGSFRLVLKDDHLPYGQLMRAYGNDPVAYRYNGQKSDQETGVNNYHVQL
ncbi:hypothetical protein OUZ56_022918 [Daphnia magna]|uniref:Uncharacterized protein n=1 Tax=Daphnia magna TaxID=35525 RepID=A0ABR0AXV2_9CRUS|nr:hypothetical protein OUZ56_022918 [Daphnia magna]